MFSFYPPTHTFLFLKIVENSSSAGRWMTKRKLKSAATVSGKFQLFLSRFTTEAAGKRVEFCYGESLTNQSESRNNNNPVCVGFSRLFVNISSSWSGVVFASVASAPCTRQWQARLLCVKRGCEELEGPACLINPLQAHCLCVRGVAQTATWYCMPQFS